MGSGESLVELNFWLVVELWGSRGGIVRVWVGNFSPSISCQSRDRKTRELEEKEENQLEKEIPLERMEGEYLGMWACSGKEE